METVQLTIHDEPYAAALRELLESTGGREIRCVATPDPKQDGVIVVDSATLGCLPLPLCHPERVVLITSNDPKYLAEAWNAGIRSVVFNQDPISTAVLAIMAAELRVPKSDPRCGAAHGPAAAPLAEVHASAPMKSRDKKELT